MRRLSVIEKFACERGNSTYLIRLVIVCRMNEN